MSAGSSKREYELKLINTSDCTGYFGCRPVAEPGFDKAAAELALRPYDDFLHKYLRSIVSGFDKSRIIALIKEFAPKEPPVISALLYEVCLFRSDLADVKDMFENVEKLSRWTPLIEIKSSLLSDQGLHRKWAQIFNDNINFHRPLPDPQNPGLPLPQTNAGRSPDQKTETPSIGELHKKYSSGESEKKEAPAPETVAANAITQLEKIGVFHEIEQRHVSSLSPIALLRRWKMNLSVDSHRHNYLLSGIQTSYGKGLSLEAARASCSMEIVERVSSFASFDGDRICGYLKRYKMKFCGYGELKGEGISALNPDDIHLEVPYNDEKIFWMEGVDTKGEPVWIPVQSVFLFCNLDEPNLFSGLGSTGLASGTSIEGAKVSGLLEVIERDAEATTPYDPKRCFKLETRNPHLRPLFDAYRSKGIDFQFQDMTTELGVPCYKCFVTDQEGQVIKASAAHPDGRRAVMSALTETPYPFPYGPPSKPGPAGLPAVMFEDLPNYTTENSALDLKILEQILESKGYSPLYVDITREDLRIPVVRAIVPGLELMADFDSFSRISPRLIKNYR